MVAQNVAFWILAIAMAGAAIGVVRSQNVVHAALYLVVVLAGAAAQYILLAAEFVAWVQVLASRLREMRPQGAPPLFGVNFHQVSYRAAVCYRGAAGHAGSLGQMTLSARQRRSCSSSAPRSWP